MNPAMLVGLSPYAIVLGMVLVNLPYLRRANRRYEAIEEARTKATIAALEGKS